MFPATAQDQRPLADRLRNVPDSAVRNMSNVKYISKTDTMRLSSGAAGGFCLTSDMLTSSVRKTRRHTNIRKFGAGVFGDKLAYLANVRCVVPPWKADGTTAIAKADRDNLLLGHGTFSVSEKPVMDFYLTELPGGEGDPTGLTTVNQNGMPHISNVLWLPEPYPVLPEESLQWEVVWAGGCTLTADCDLVFRFGAYTYDTPR